MEMNRRTPLVKQAGQKPRPSASGSLRLIPV
ncbi:hypothetical protein LR69_01395 [Geobacillus sp. BCO2]|nr:hypothetical protein LR69_01395 [Geobacillus sp. BCO2]